MKSMKWMVAPFVAAGMMTIASCSNDPEPTKVDPEDNLPGVAIKSITDKNGNAVTLTKVSGNITFDYIYNTNTGNLTKVLWGSGAYKPTTFSGNSTNFTATYKETEDGETLDESLEVKTNGQGNVTFYKSVMHDYDSQGTYNLTTTETVDFNYNSSDQITYIEINKTKLGTSKSGSANERYLYKINLTWENGNIKKMETKAYKGSDEYPSSEQNFSYGSGDNSAKQMPFSLLYGQILSGKIESNELRTLIPLGLFGKGPAKLPYGVSLKSDGTIRSDNGYTYEYSNDK